MNKLYIYKTVHIQEGIVSVNGNSVFENKEAVDFNEFAKSAYKAFDISYSKFYKMDSLSKLGFLATDVLLNGVNVSQYKPDEISILCANSSSSLHTDTKYQQTIQDIPSPAVFVYTLPNIVIGEICIRNVIRGEALFFVQDAFDTQFMSNYVHNLFETTDTKLCIVGWLEFSVSESYEAHIVLASKENSQIELNKNNIYKI